VRRIVAACIAVVAAFAGLAPAGAAAKTTEEVQVLAINDFHGNLEPPTGSSGRIQVGPASTDTVDAGGAAFLATHFKQLREGHKRTLSVGAGDLVGASPLISGIFHDEPTVEALNAMGLQASAVGNHEFDEGYRELLRLQRGGCHPVDGCQDGDPFFGANFQWLAANVRFGPDATILPRYWVRGVGSGIRIGFIGLTLEGTPTIVTPAGVAGLEFDDEVQTVNRYAASLRRKGVNAIFVLIHQGGQQNPPYANGFQDINGCDNLSGDILPIIHGLSSFVDVVASAHTHQAYNCRIDGKLVTSASSFGRLITEFDLTLSKKTRDVVAATAVNHIVTRDVTPDAKVQAIVDEYKAKSAPIANQVFGTATAAFSRFPPAGGSGESTLGDLIADSQLAATSSPDTGGAQIAFQNPGGVRADLDAGEVTYAELFAVQPFGNTLNVKTFTGQQIKDLLEQQFDNPSAGQVRILQPSKGFSYSYSASAPKGSKVSDLALNGTPIDLAASYRVTMNSFLATGGDGFTVFNDGTDILGGPVDVDAFSAYVKAQGTVSPAPLDRITVLP
jgi:5'-nucleotidase